MRHLFLAALLVATTACDTGLSTSRNWEAVRIEDLRVELGPDESLDVPIELQTSDAGSASMTIDATVVSHGSALEVLPELALEPASGQVTGAPDDPLSLRCADNCEGEHTIRMSLPATAPAPVTVDVSINARGDRDGLTLQVGKPLASTAWRPTPVSRSRGMTTGRLHITSPIDPGDGLRLEVPLADVHAVSGSLIVDDSNHVSDVTPGTSLTLSTPPGACGEVWCDWSLGVASVVPWRVVASSTEFDVSFSENDRSLLGGSTWTGTIEGGETVDLTLDVSAPGNSGTTVVVVVRVDFTSDPRSQGDPDVAITFGDWEIRHISYSSDATRILVPLECDVDRCHGSMPVRIDARAKESAFDLELGMSAGRAYLDSTTGEVNVELRP